MGGPFPAGQSSEPEARVVCMPLPLKASGAVASSFEFFFARGKGVSK